MHLHSKHLGSQKLLPTKVLPKIYILELWMNHWSFTNVHQLYVNLPCFSVFLGEGGKGGEVDIINILFLRINFWGEGDVMRHCCQKLPVRKIRKNHQGELSWEWVVRTIRSAFKVWRSKRPSWRSLKTWMIAIFEDPICFFQKKTAKAIHIRESFTLKWTKSWRKYEIVWANIHVKEGVRFLYLLAILNKNNLWRSIGILPTTPLLTKVEVETNLNKSSSQQRILTSGKSCIKHFRIGPHFETLPKRNYVFESSPLKERTTTIEFTKIECQEFRKIAVASESWVLSKTSKARSSLVASARSSVSQNQGRSPKARHGNRVRRMLRLIEKWRKFDKGRISGILVDFDSWNLDLKMMPLEISF